MSIDKDFKCYRNIFSNVPIKRIPQSAKKNILLVIGGVQSQGNQFDFKMIY